MRQALAIFILVGAGCEGGPPSSALDLSMRPAADDLAVRANVPPPEPPMVSHGGPTLGSMQLWTLVWAGDEDLGARIDAFHATVFASPYWQSLAEYGVGPGTARGVYVIPGARPKTITQNEESAIVEGLLAAHEIPDTDQTVIDFVVGADVESFEGQALASACDSFSGYHFETSDPPHHPFLVELPCQDPSKKLSVFDNLTWTDSHEMAESATDPHPATQPGWQLAYREALEVGDMCLIPTQLDGTAADGAALSYTVSRVYSAKAAAMGGVDPCVPAPVGPYSNVGLQPSDVQVLSGKTVTVNLVAFSTDSGGAPQPLNWRASTAAMLTPDHGTAMPGDIIPVTVAPLSFLPAGASFYFVVEITDPNDPATAIQAWVGTLDIE